MRRETSLYIIFFFALGAAVGPYCHARGSEPKARRQSVAFADSSRYYIFTEGKDLSADAVRDFLRKNPARSKAIALKTLFDSLGFFAPSFTVRSADTVDIASGPRTMVDTLRITGPAPVSIDSVFKLKLPRPYDQGEIRAVAKKAVYFLGTRGYPFATLSVTLGVGAPSPGRGGISVELAVRDNGRYGFSKPLFTGNIKTSRRLLSHDILFSEGEAFDLRKVEGSRQRLALRPYIMGVDVGPPAVLLDADADASPVAVSTQSLDKVLVPFMCEDQSGLGFDGALAFQAGGPSAASSFSGIVNISLLNVLHSGESAEITYNGQKDYSKLSFSLAKPYLFDMPLFASGDFGLEIQAEKNGFLHGALEGLTEFSVLWQLGLGINGHEVWDTGGTSSEYTGVDIILSRQRERTVAGAFSKDLVIRTGNGLAHNNGRQFDRWHVDISGGVQVPLTSRLAIGCHAVAQSLFTQQDDSLQTVELYRTGGYRSIRGYSDNEFAFKTVFYVQGEYLLYFSSEGAVYAFSDAGAGFGPYDQVNFDVATRMLSYGIGLHIPVKIGRATIEWARNYKDTQSLGRIHVSIQNPISAALGK
jgi:outer membrane protein assembly factor BamA